MEAKEQKEDFLAHLMKIIYRPRPPSKSLKKPKADPELLPLIRYWILFELDRRHGCLFAVEKAVGRGDKKILHQPACLEMLRGFNCNSTPNNEREIVDCTDFNHDQWMSLPKQCSNCCSSLWIGTVVCLASLGDHQSIRMVIPGEFARLGNYFKCLAWCGQGLPRVQVCSKSFWKDSRRPTQTIFRWLD